MNDILHKISFFRLPNEEIVKSWEFKENSLILRIFIERDLIAEYYIPLKELKEALEKV